MFNKYSKSIKHKIKHKLNINIQYQAIKYYLRFPTVNKNRLLYEAYENAKKLNSTGEQNTFITYVIDVLNNLGLSHIAIARDGGFPSDNF